MPPTSVPINRLPRDVREMIAAILEFESDRCAVCGEAHHVGRPATLGQGHADNLVLNSGEHRVWHNRTGDGEPFAVEVNDQGTWLTVDVLDEPTIRTEDGKLVRERDRVFNYYDGFWGELGPIDSDGWADVTASDGRRAYLNGQRISTYDPRGSTDPNPKASNT